MADSISQKIIKSRGLRSATIIGIIIAVIVFFILIYLILRLLGTFIFGTFAAVNADLRSTSNQAASFFSFPTISVPDTTTENGTVNIHNVVAGRTYAGRAVSSNGTQSQTTGAACPDNSK